MHAGAFDRTEGFDGTRQFTFQRALVVHLLAELADAEFFLIEQFKTYRAAFRQAELGQTQAQFMHFVSGHFQRAAVIGETIGDVHLGQLGHDGPPVLIGQVAEQRAIVRGFGPQHHCHENSHRGGTGHHQWNFWISAQAIDPFYSFILWRSRSTRAHCAPRRSWSMALNVNENKADSLVKTHKDSDAIIWCFGKFDGPNNPFL